MLRLHGFYDKSSMFRICNLYLHRSEFLLITTTFFKFATPSNLDNSIYIYIYIYYVYLYGFKSAQEALPKVRINQVGRIYCGALETATSYTPSIFQKLGHWQTGLESTILSPDVKTNSPMDRIVHIISFYILKYLCWTIGRPLPSGKCILAYMSSCICVSRPELPKTFQEANIILPDGIIEEFPWIKLCPSSIWNWR